MALSAAVITSTNLANWIPRIWSKQILADVQKALVTGARMDRRFEAFAKDGGSVIVVPSLAEITASAINVSQDHTLYNAVQNVTNISINKYYATGVAVSDIEELQTNPKYFDLVQPNLVYGVKKQIEINCNVLFKDLDNSVGTVNVALTEDDFISAWTKVNLYDAPPEDRAWILDPETIEDIVKRDYFVNMQYVPENVVTAGFLGKQIFGSPVYMTTALDTYAGGPHAAGYFHRQALALVIQGEPKIEVFRLPLQFSDGMTVKAIFGVQEMRGTWGCVINTRS